MPRLPTPRCEPQAGASVGSGVSQGIEAETQCVIGSAWSLERRWRGGWAKRRVGPAAQYDPLLLRGHGGDEESGVLAELFARHARSCGHHHVDHQVGVFVDGGVAVDLQVIPGTGRDWLALDGTTATEPHDRTGLLGTRRHAGRTEARRAHNPKVVGSNPTPATIETARKRRSEALTSVGASRLVPARLLTDFLTLCSDASNGYPDVLFPVPSSAIPCRRVPSCHGSAPRRGALRAENPKSNARSALRTYEARGATRERRM